MEKDRIPIYIVGYPKSGNTWLTRLVGDTLNSPTGSAYGKHQADLATEGWNRPGKYIVLKSHHSQKDKPEFITTQSKIIYIYRDFRDVLISGFFHHYRIDESYILQTDPTNNRSFYQKMWQILFRVEMANLTRGWGSFSSGNQLSKVCVNFLKGRWFFHRDFVGGRVGSWSDHIYYWANFSPNVFILSYEDLIGSSYGKLKEAFDFLTIDYDEQRLLPAIDRQSFKNKKNSFKKMNDTTNLNFLRKGVAGDWKRFLSVKQVNYVIKKHGNMLQIMGYLK